MTQAIQGSAPFDVRRIEIDARVGGQFTFSDMRQEGEAVHWGYYIEMDCPRKLVFSWFTSEKEEQEASSIITLTLEPLTVGCRATIVHTMHQRWAEYVKRTEMGWGTMMRKIEMILAANTGEK